MKTPRWPSGQPKEPPKQPRWMRHHCPSHHQSDPSHPDSGYIVRMMLRNGYWSYRPDRLICLTEHNDAYQRNAGRRPPWQDLSRPQRHIPLREGVWLWDGVDSGASAPVKKSKVRRWKRLAETTASRVRSTGVKWRLDAQGGWVMEDWRVEVVPGDEPQFEVNAKGVEGTVVVAGKAPMPVRVRDDPIESGRELAAAGDTLPSDWRRCGGYGPARGVSVISREEKELVDAWRAVAATDGRSPLGEIVHDEPVYSVWVIPLKRRGKKGAVGAKGKDVEMPDAASESLPSGHAVEDSEFNCRQVLFQEMEAQGWVPVAGWAEGEDEDELASVAASWIMAEDETGNW